MSTPPTDSNEQSAFREGNPLPVPPRPIEDGKQPWRLVTTRPGFRLLTWPGLAVALVIGIGIGVVLDRFVLPSSSTDGRGTGNLNARKGNLSSWEVNDILGSGEIVAEDGFIVDAQGRFKKYSRRGGSYSDTTGTINGHDGKAKQDITQDLVWRDGVKAIFVTISNNKVVNRRDEHLYDR